MREIIRVFLKYGLDFILDRLGLGGFRWPRPKKEVEEMPRGRRLRYAFQELGPTFIKLGQILSIRADLLPPDIIEELSYLQDEVEPFSSEEALNIIEEELKISPLELFSYINEEPLAAASIGQVHYAELKDGRQAAIKVKRPGVEEIIETDIEILFDIAQFAQKHTSLGETYDLIGLVEEFQESLQKELDYVAEGKNAELFNKNFSKNNKVYIPQVYWEYTTTSVLALEYIDGLKLSDVDFSERDNLSFDSFSVANTLVDAVLQMILEDGFFHADPHPGNLVVLEENVLGLLDFGMVGRISAEERQQFASLVMGMLGHNSERIIDAMFNLGFVADDVDFKALRREVDRLRDKYYQMPLEEINLGKAINEVLEVAFYLKVRVPTQFALLAKCMMTAEGVARTLDPSLSPAKIAEIYSRRLLLKKLMPSEMVKDFYNNLREYGSVILELPEILSTLLKRIQRDQLRLKVNLENLNEAMFGFLQIFNRVVLALIFIGFSIFWGTLILAVSINPAIFPSNIMLYMGLGALLIFIFLLILLWLIHRSGKS
jgi:ubiquinone biosynthesis protein